MIQAVNFMFAIVLIQAVADTLGGSSRLGSDTKADLQSMYGSLTKAMWTLYLSTTGGTDWTAAGAPLVYAGCGYYYLFVFYMNFQTIALTNVVLGLFVDTAMRAAGTDHVA